MAAKPPLQTKATQYFKAQNFTIFSLLQIVTSRASEVAKT
jgi:hypothetical protein